MMTPLAVQLNAPIALSLVALVPVTHSSQPSCHGRRNVDSLVPIGCLQVALAWNAR